MSLTNPNKVVTEERLADFYQSILPYLGGMPDVCGGGFAPIGTVIAFMGTTAPQDYLACDGTVYNIADYPRLAQFFTDQFGSANKFGGNGTTTFAVPDLRGEFLRGTGTNSHTNQGNGSNVGTHQDGTEHVWVGSWFTGNANKAVNYVNVRQNYVSSTGANAPSKIDKSLNHIESGRAYVNSTEFTVTTDPTASADSYTSRPTNTSILWCIKAVEPGEVYSTSERIVGTWIDGKPLYQKTFDIGYLTLNTEANKDVTQSYSATMSGIDKIINTNGLLVFASGNTQNASPIYVLGNNYSGSYICLIADKTNQCFKVTAGADRTTVYAYATIRYTKTTD